MNIEFNNEILSETAMEVLSDSAFIFTEISDTEELTPSYKNTVYKANVNCNGRIKGNLCIASDKEFGLELAANMLGIDKENLESDILFKDALGEFCNILAGVLMSKYADKNGNYELGIPLIIEYSPDQYGQILAKSPYSVILLTDDDERIDICFNEHNN